MVELPTESDPVRVIEGDNLAVLPTLAESSVDSVTTDPPYGLEFMGAAWDSFKATGTSRLMHSPKDEGREFTNASGHMWDNTKALPRMPHAGKPFQEWCGQWGAAVLRVLKPGGYMLCFGGTRTYHRLACAVEDAGFEIRDCLMWIHGQGFPKGKGCLKPAVEPILLCRKPGKRVLPLSVDACRVPCEERPNIASKPKSGAFAGVFREGSSADGTTTLGRYPANVLHDGSDEVLEAFAAFGEKTSGKQCAGGHVRNSDKTRNTYGKFPGQRCEGDVLYGDTGTAARFFYAAKASKRERAGSKHPTVKPLALMRWLVRLVTPEGGLTLDPFAGSGATVEAALLEGFRAVAIERESEYCADIRKRVERVRQGTGLFADAG